MGEALEPGRGVTRPRRILLVEDDRDLREALCDALRDSGHAVVAVSDGGEALRQMRIERPDLVVLDLMMPIVDGWQFRVEQKRDPVLASTPVVAISASQSAAAAAVDAELYLQKPFDASVLVRSIDDVLRAIERRHEPAEIAQTERLAALGTLAAGLAHEINNPLTYVMLHLGQMSKRLGRLSTARNRKQLDELRVLLDGAIEGTERIRDVAGSIRTFSRVGDHAEALVDVTAVLDDALKLVGHEITHRARLARRIATAPPVLANEGRLVQVFINLLTNAVQAIPEGRATEHEIRVATGTTADGWAFVTIGDTGCGIAKHLLGRIFEPFFTTKPPGQGSGLGLSISHGIVTSLGGRIAVWSEDGRGTTFQVLLPPASHRVVARPPTTEPVSQSSSGRRRSVLVVDDDVGVVSAIARELRGDHDVVTAASGREALELIEVLDPFDAILCDLHMPDVSGVELFDVLGAVRPELAERVVFMTAGAFTGRARELLATARNPAIAKPVDPIELRALLARMG
ncbi:MAG: response regulator [Deltaproteobacteria bacterium]|nr:response regulator [Deltaproteobacteria bacterium]